MFAIAELMERNIGTMITGVTIVNGYSQGIHAFEGAKCINMLGGTHYSTEKYVPIKMCSCFHALGLPCQFIDDAPDLCDL